jgi:hypothetical protein
LVAIELFDSRELSREENDVLDDELQLMGGLRSLYTALIPTNIPSPASLHQGALIHSTQKHSAEVIIQGSRRSDVEKQHSDPVERKSLCIGKKMSVMLRHLFGKCYNAVT